MDRSKGWRYQREHGPPEAGHSYLNMGQDRRPEISTGTWTRGWTYLPEHGPKAEDINVNIKPEAGYICLKIKWRLEISTVPEHEPESGDI
jgi:hypothetical protein